MDSDIVYAKKDETRPYVIVIGNEKGGTGKSTTAVHLAVALAETGYSVGCIDFDARQATLSRYLENRMSHRDSAGRSLAVPEFRRVGRHDQAGNAAVAASETAWARGAFEDLAESDFIVIDTPGSDSHLSRLAHLNADTLITPLNDSFLDIDVLARLDTQRREVVGPSVYTQMVWEQNNRRIAAGVAPIDWVVMRNRLTHIASRNKREIAGLMVKLSKRIGFRLASGFGERVIFRELFFSGPTLIDLGRNGTTPPSRQAASREIGELLRTIGITEGVSEGTSEGISEGISGGVADGIAGDNAANGSAISAA